MVIMLLITQDMTSQSRSITTQAQAITAQANREGVKRVNANEGTTASRLRDFVKMNPSIFLGSQVGEDP